MFQRSGFDKLIDKATSNLLMEPDWTTILKICDMIRQNDVQPKTALAGVKKKLNSTNPHTAMYAIQLLESMVKNCGSSVHEELMTQAFCESLSEIIRTTQHENVRQKMLELIQAWAYAFRNNPKCNHLKEMINVMKSDGYKFPQMRESDAMFSADSAPVWADGEVCHRCRAQFSMILRKHHCRACGQVFCGQCSSKTSTLPKFGIEKEVRVCDACFEAVNKPSTTAVAVSKDADLEEYLKSSLAQQSQLPPRKSDSEIQEEEEFQLALAISQSEAEAKEKEKLRVTSAYGSFRESGMSRPNERSPSPEAANPELARYLQRSYWENRQSDLTNNDTSASPSAPSPAAPSSIEIKSKENGVAENEIEEFVKTLKSQVEIFINRMKSNSSRGRSITYDNSVQTLFMNITAMHSKLLKYIQEHDDSRLYFERLQDKLAQVKDARAALDALRDEHQEKLRLQAEEAERQRQMLMAHKLDIMRKKKQEYLQYQRQVALQRIQEQEREMQMRQEQQKQQYIMAPQYFMGSPVHGPQFPPNSGFGYQFPNPQPMMGLPGQAPQTGPPGIGMPPNSMPNFQMPGMAHPNMQPPGQNIPPHPNMQQQGQNMPNPNMQQPGLSMHHPNMPPQNMGNQNIQPPPQSLPHNVPPQNMQGPQSMPPNQMMGNPNMMPPNQNMLPNQNGLPPNQMMPGQPMSPMSMQHSMQYQQPGAPPASPQIQPKEETQTAELISFD